MSDEFIVKCTRCLKHGLYRLDDVKSPRQLEKLTGNVACKHCSKSNHVELKKCPMCHSAWSNYDKDPLVTTAMFEIRTGSTCPTCNPEIRENVLKYGQEFVRRST